MEIILTEKAKNELGKLEEKTKGGKFIRVFVAAFGWGGPTFGVALDELKDGDMEIEHDGSVFIFEKELAKLLKKVEIDYVNLPFFSKFVVNAYQN